MPKWLFDQPEHKKSDPRTKKKCPGRKFLKVQFFRFFGGQFFVLYENLCWAQISGKDRPAGSGVFGAGKTRAAAAIIAGLITVDPSLKIMILTKENVASQAFAEHIIGLSLPTWIERKFGRLVGFMALQNQTTFF